MLPLILLLDGDGALYLAVCGNTDVSFTYRRGTAALFLPRTSLMCRTSFRAHPPPPMLASPKKWCHPETQLPHRAGCGRQPALVECATSRVTLPAQPHTTRSGGILQGGGLATVELNFSSNTLPQEPSKDPADQLSPGQRTTLREKEW